MAAKRPKDMTEAEREALREGPRFSTVPERCSVIGYGPDDLACWQDNNGDVWQFGADHLGWYKRRAGPEARPWLALLTVGVKVH